MDELITEPYTRCFIFYVDALGYHGHYDRTEYYDREEATKAMNAYLREWETWDEPVTDRLYLVEAAFTQVTEPLGLDR